MAKQQDVTVVSDLCARANFTVSSKGKLVDGKMVGVVPRTEFSVQVTYSNQIELLEYAVPTTIIDLQGFLREEYLATGKFSFAAKTMIKVGANGKYGRPAPLPSAQRIAEATLAEKLIILASLGIEPTAEWLVANTPQAIEEPVVEAAADTTNGDLGEDEEYKYNEEELATLSLIRLKVLAQKEEFEGYDDMDKDTLVEELALVLK